MTIEMMNYLSGDERLTRKRLGKIYEWSDDLRIAAKYCKQHGLTLELVDIQYQVAKIKGDDIKLVIYPHKTSSGHYHLRVRDESSKDKEKAIQHMYGLDIAAGFNCTFSHKYGTINERMMYRDSTVQ